MAQRRDEKRLNFEPPPGWKYELVPEVPVAQPAVHTENETSTFQWALWTVTCAASSCAAVAGLVVIVIEISKNWQGLTNTATTP